MKEFLKEVYFLQIELLKLQEWVIDNNQKVLIIFEGRDAAGKGNAIGVFTEHLNPKGFRIETFGIPTEEEKNNWFQRYEKVLPKDGEIVFFDRSWYNRAVVEPVMGYCSKDQYEEFIDTVNDFEKNLINSGTQIIKIWLSVDKSIQRSRFEIRKTNPLGYWKFSSNDKKVIKKWDEFTFYINKMFKKTHTKICPWHVIDSNDSLMFKLEAIKKVLDKFSYQNKKIYENIKTDSKKIIFLDIDGVLMPQQNDISVDKKDFDKDNFWSKNAIRCLNRLTDETGAKIVITSSYRKLKTLSQLIERFKIEGIKGKIIDKISSTDDLNRAQDVKKWLKLHPGITHFVAIDDTVHHYNEVFPYNYVQPEHDLGLSDENIERAINILTNRKFV